MLLKEQLIIVEIIPFRDFRDKIRITKELKNIKIAETTKDYIYVERVEVSE